MLAKIQNGLEPDEVIGHFDHAIELAEQLLKKQPELKELDRLAGDSLSLRSELLAKNGELDLAIADIERAKELIDDPDLNLDRHKEMLELRKVFRAELSKYESGELKPKNAMETLALARELTCDRHKNYATALKLYQELFEGDFKQAEAFNSELAWIEGAKCALALALQDGVKKERKVELFTTTREILSQRVAMFHEAPAESRREAGWFLRGHSFVACRDLKKLEFLPEEEQLAWAELWQQVKKFDYPLAPVVAR